MRSWGPLLLILVLPVVVIGGVIAIRSNVSAARQVFIVMSAGYGVATVSMTLAANSRKPDLSKGIDEQAITL